MSIQEQVKQRLTDVYGPRDAAMLLEGLTMLQRKYATLVTPMPQGWSEKDALLITYADSLVSSEAPLHTLHHFLHERVSSLISFVHLLPFFPYTSDDGFAVTDFRALREDLGTWEDIRSFSKDYRLVFDAVINHVSAANEYVTGYCSGDPDYADFVIALPPDTDTSKVLRTRNLPLLRVA